MRALLLVLFVGCASGGRPDVVVDASGGGTSDGTMITIDSSMTMTDGGPAQRTLSQTTSNMIEPITSLACPADVSGTAANNYYRVFDLAAFGITSEFKVTKVSFQVEHCNDLDGSNGAVVAVRVGTYDGVPGETLANASMTILASNPNVQVPEVIEVTSPTPMTPGGTVDAPISATIPAGSKLLVEVDAPNGNASYELYMGANNDGESGFGYILAPDCNVTVPTNISSVGDTSTIDRTVHLLMTVTGTY